jgi:general secretion pathway protein D
MYRGVLALLCIALASCASTGSSEQTGAGAGAPAAPAAGSADSEPADSGPAAAAGSANPPPVIPGEPDSGAAATTAALGDIQRDGRAIQIGQFPEAAPRVQVQGDQTIALNLEQEDLRRVFEQLGDALQLNMVIDPAIDSVVSVRTTEDNPLTFDDIWPLMRLLARNAGVTIEQAGNVYEFSLGPQRVPVEVVMPGWLGQSSASEVLQVTPLRYISRETAVEVLGPILQDEGSIIPLGARNSIGISGPPGMLTRINGLLEVIDDDPFLNQGIKLYSLRYTQATDVAEEMTNILRLIQGETGAYQVLGLARINAVLVVGAPARGFDEVDRWIAILDNESQEQVEQLFFYKVKNLDALALATTLTNVFGQEDEEAVNLLTQGGAVDVNALAAANQIAVPNQNVGPDNAPIFVAQAPAAPAGTDNAVSADLAVAIVADEDTNSLLIRSTPRDYRQLLQIISRLDTLPKQVMINAVIGQATLSEGTSYGVDWVRVSQNLNSGPARLTSQFLPAGILDDNGLATPGSGLVLTRSFANGSATIDATLNAIAIENEVRLLARPTIMATNNQEGEIIVGQEVPVDSGSSISGNGTVVSNISYRDVGIVLTITPHVNEDGYINLEIFQSLSSVEDSAGGVSDNPIFTNQEITTTAVVADEAVIALGGLIQEEETSENNGIPGLRKIPGLGALFSYRDRGTVRRELFVILRPQIIDGDAGDAAANQAFRDRFENLKAALDEVWD